MRWGCLALAVLATGCAALPSPPVAPALVPRRRAPTNGGLVHKLVGEVEMKAAAVSNVFPRFPGDDSAALLVSSYEALGSDPVYVVRNVAGMKQGDKGNATTLVSSLPWCNMLRPVNETVFGQSGLVLTAGGFLVPSKTTGAIDLVDLNQTPPAVHQVSTDKKGYFYHHAELHDLNGDGRLDILAARANVPTLPWQPKHGELIWLEQPSSDPLSASWEEHVLTQGPDVGFVFADLDGDGKQELVATQFFTASQLALYWCEEETWGQCDASSIKSRVIDDSLGPYFNVQLQDMNKDGKNDLLVTNNRNDGQGAVFVFEIPDDVRTGNFPRHTLSSGYKPPASIQPGKGAPGLALAFFPNTTDTTAKPLVLLSSDDQGTLSILTPKSQDEGDWEYDEEFVYNSTGTVGTPSVFDVDGDGLLEFFVPLYEEGKVQVYTFVSN